MADLAAASSCRVAGSALAAELEVTFGASVVADGDGDAEGSGSG
jgi:hypothetical protein